jgi:hypothetical protein
MFLIGYKKWSVKPMSKYEEFQEWLNQCPIKITEYQDNVTSFAIDFEIVDEDAEAVEQCIIDGNDYKDCVDRMVATMKSPVELENVTDEWYDKEGNLIP